MVVLVGLTGGISSGKTTVSDLIKKQSMIKKKNSLSIIDADKVSHDILENDSKIKEKIGEKLGKQIFKKDNSIDRQILSKLVFSNKAKRNALNEIIHPAILKKLIQEIVVSYLKGSRFIIIVAPLLFESGLNQIMSLNIVVHCSEQRQRVRLMHRDKITQREAEQKMQSQMSLAEKCKKADYIIPNDGVLEELEKSVEKFLGEKYPSFFKGHIEKIGFFTVFSLIVYLFIKWKY